jgi:hypothetical protein
MDPTEEENVTRTITDKLRNPDLVQYAQTLGLFPMAVRFHLECQGSLDIPHERRLFIKYKQERRRRRKLVSRLRTEAIANSTTIAPDGRASIEYYPGIELKLGKERDTVIRPMVTAVFRSNREAFKTALLQAGLKYGELRMWKDAQLCTALHIADAFHPGIWDKAVELHVKKSLRNRGSISRSRGRTAADDPYSI